MDNAGENIEFKNKCKEKNLIKMNKWKFEFTAQRTPQFNGTVERKFPTLLEELEQC